MIDEKAIVSYKLIIKRPNEEDCVNTDPIGMCSVTDCINCKHALVKIIREDGMVMRNDWKKNKRNSNQILTVDNAKPTIKTLEDMFGIKLSLIQKIQCKFGYWIRQKSKLRKR